MFDFQPNPPFTWPVKVRVPQKDGTYAEQVFTAEWRAVNEDEIRTAIADWQKAREEADALPEGATRPKLARNAAQVLFEKCLVGWQDDLRANGQPFPFTPANVELVALDPLVASALTLSYWDAVQGAMRAKN